MSEFHFLRPYALLGLLPIVLTYFLLKKHHSYRGAWTRVIDRALQPYVLSGTGEVGKRRASWLWYLLAALLIVALAGPAWQKLPQPVYTQHRPLIVALDLSQSMTAKDVLPSRLSLAKIKLQDILVQRADGQCALIVFAGDAFSVVPLTDDYRTIVSLLPTLEPSLMPVQGSRIAPAIAMAEQLFRQAGTGFGELIVLTDGLADFEPAKTAAKTLAQFGHRTSVVGFGTTQGDVVKDPQGDFVKDRNGEVVVATLPEQQLRQVAIAGQGIYINALDDNQQLERFAAGDPSLLADFSVGDNLSSDVWRDQGPWLLLFCLPFVALAFRRGLVFCVVMCVLVPSGLGDTKTWANTGVNTGVNTGSSTEANREDHAWTSVWSDLWSRRDQQGQQQFDAENYQRAAELFKDPQRQAAALFRSQQYEQSAARLEGINQPDAHYNRGNALAHSGDIAGAITAYQQALALDADHVDARHNLETLQQLQNEQQQQEQQQNQSPQEDNQQASEDSSDESEEQQQSEQSDEQESANQESPNQESLSAEQSEQDEQEDSQAQETDQEQPEAEEQQRRQQAQLTEELSEEEQQQAVEQWLRQIPDDPGGLLRRKFKRQYRERSGRSRETHEQW